MVLIVSSFSSGRDFEVYFGEIQTIIKVEMSEREKKAGGLETQGEG